MGKQSPNKLSAVGAALAKPARTELPTYRANKTGLPFGSPFNPLLTSGPVTRMLALVLLRFLRGFLFLHRHVAVPPMERFSLVAEPEGQEPHLS